MNVIFHTATAIGIVAIITDTNRIERVTIKSNLHIAIIAFVAGIIAHGILDYMPHCYPVNSKVDAAVGLLAMFTLTLLTNRRYRLLSALAFIGCVFPDLIDLSPGILNKYLGLNISVPDKIFPWHNRRYSGSLYTGDCGLSTLNHLLVLLSVATICWFRRADLSQIFGKARLKIERE